MVGVRPFFRTVLHTTTVLYVGFFFENSFHLTRRSYCLPGLIVFLCTPPPCAFEFEMSRTRLLLFIALLSFAFALEMPCRRTPEAAERDRARKRRKRADQSAEDRARVNHQRRERYAQKRALQTSEEREQSNVRRRELRIEMDAEERETVNERRRDQYAQESAQLPAACGRARSSKYWTPRDLCGAPCKEPWKNSQQLHSRTCVTADHVNDTIRIPPYILLLNPT